MRSWIAFVSLLASFRVTAQLPERPEASPVDEAQVGELVAVGLAASAAAQRTLDARVLPFDLTWGLR